MKKKIMTGVLGMAAMFMGGAQAAEVFVNPPSFTNVSPGDILMGGITLPDGTPRGIAIEATGFNQGVISGGFKLTWDPTLLSLDTSTVFPNWSSDMVNDGMDQSIPPLIGITTGSGFVQMNFSGCSLGGGCNQIGDTTGGSFTLMTGLAFKVSQNFTTGTNLSLGIDAFGDTWKQPDLTTTYPVTYTGATLSSNGGVGTVPLPAAAWLMGGGLVGMLGMSRRRKSLMA